MPDRGMALAVGKAVYLVDKEHFVRQDRAGCTLSAEQKDRTQRYHVSAMVQGFKSDSSDCGDTVYVPFMEDS